MTLARCREAIPTSKYGEKSHKKVKKKLERMRSKNVAIREKTFMVRCEKSVAVRVVK